MIYIPQIPMKKDQRTGVVRQKFDVREVQARLGDYKILLDSTPRMILLATQPTIQKLRFELKNFCDDDAILPMGHPALIGLTVAVAASFNNGRVRQLSWDRKLEEYIEIVANIHGGSYD